MRRFIEWAVIILTLFGVWSLLYAAYGEHYQRGWDNGYREGLNAGKNIQFEASDPNRSFDLSSVDVRQGR